MALVTQVPILVDPTHFSRQQGDRTLFVRGTNLYLVWPYNDTSAMAVYKSTDQGLTWAEMDVAGKPAGAFTIRKFFDDTSNDLISILYTPDNINHRFVNFSTATDTYGTPSNSVNLAGYTPEVFWHKLAGTPVIILTTGSTSHYATTYNGSSWSAIGAPIKTFGSTGFITTGFRDGAGVYHALIVLNSSTTLNYIEINDSLVVTNPVLLYTGGNSIFQVSPLVTDGAKQYLSASITESPSTYSVRGFVGSALVSPSWSNALADSLTVFDQATYPDAVIDKDGNFVVFWTVLGSSFDETRMATFNGSTFDAFVLFYDAVTNPPPNADVFNFIHTWGAHQFGDGTWVAGTAMETTDLGGSCTGFILTTAMSAIATTVDIALGLGISFSFGFSGGPPGPNPPPFCIPVPVSNNPDVIAYNEPLERTGS